MNTASVQKHHALRRMIGYRADIFSFHGLTPNPEHTRIGRIVDKLYSFGLILAPLNASEPGESLALGFSS